LPLPHQHAAQQTRPRRSYPQLSFDRGATFAQARSFFSH
jgi:hypothetical protein